MEIIINNTKVIVDVADTFKKRLLGLMGKENITKGMFFPKTGSIHTFFMHDDIDIIMINKKKEVIYFQKKLSKNKIIIKKEAYHTIELPKNTIDNLNIGDKLIIKD